MIIVKIFLTIVLLVASVMFGIIASAGIAESTIEKTMVFLSASLALFAMMFINVVMKF